MIKFDYKKTKCGLYTPNYEVDRNLNPMEIDMFPTGLSPHICEVSTITTDEFGNQVEVIVGRNHVLLGGLQLHAQRFYNKPFQAKIDKFEDLLFANADNDERGNITVTENGKRWIMAVNIASSGSQGATEEAEPNWSDGVQWNGRNTMDEWIPWREIHVSENNYDLYRTKYLHSRVITADNGEQYVQYFSKIIDITYKPMLDSGTIIGDYPAKTLNDVSKDARVLAEFMLNVDKGEIIEYWQHHKRGGAQTATFNAIMLMDGAEATIRALNDKTYATMADTYVYAKSNHKCIMVGASGTVAIRYKMMSV